MPSQLKLNQVSPNQSLKILALPASLRTELIRLGICEGDLVECIAKIPGGPIVIKKKLQEIAIGQNFAAEIEVSLDDY